MCAPRKKHLWERSTKSVLENCALFLNNVFRLLHWKMIIDFNITFSFRVIPSEALSLNCGSGREENFLPWGEAHITLLHLKLQRISNAGCLCAYLTGLRPQLAPFSCLFFKVHFLQCKITLLPSSSSSSDRPPTVKCFKEALGPLSDSDPFSKCTLGFGRHSGSQV